MNEEKLKEYDELVRLVEEVKSDAEKFFIKGNKSAGTRVRKTMQEIKNAAQNVRLKVSELKGKNNI